MLSFVVMDCVLIELLFYNLYPPEVWKSNFSLERVYSLPGVTVHFNRPGSLLPNYPITLGFHEIYPVEYLPGNVKQTA